MNSKFEKKILLPALTILIATFAIVPALSPGFAETDVRVTDSRSISDVNTTDLFPQVTDVKPTDVLDKESKVKFRGGTEGWSLVGGYALPTEIHIEGTAVRGDDGIWQVEAQGKIKVDEREAKIDLKGQAQDGQLILRGVGTLEGGQQFKIILVGSYAPTLVDEQYALGFRGAWIQFGENGFRLPMMEVGKVFVSRA